MHLMATGMVTTGHMNAELLLVLKKFIECTKYLIDGLW
jgi:hypothetical protein